VHKKKALSDKSEEALTKSTKGCGGRQTHSVKGKFRKKQIKGGNPHRGSGEKKRLDEPSDLDAPEALKKVGWGGLGSRKGLEQKAKHNKRDGKG